MKESRFVLLALFCCFSFAAAPAFAGPSTAMPAAPTVSSTPASTDLLPPDPFLEGAVTTSAGATCTFCNHMIIDSCVGLHNGDTCQNNPACRCRKCNGLFECYR